MLTPLFTVTQTEEHLVLRVKCPHVRATQLETRIDGPNFRFHCKPYFLALTFSHDLAPDDADDEVDTKLSGTGSAARHRAKYDLASGFFELTLAKLEPGTHFQDLDILPSLLSGPKQYPSARSSAGGPVIEDVSTENGGEINLDGEAGDEYDDDDFDWCWPQTLPSLDTSTDPSDPMVASNAALSHYGFASHFSKFFVAHQDDVHELLDVPDPDSTTVTERRLAREIAEDTKFDEDHYIGVLIDDAETVNQLLLFEPWWASLNHLSNGSIDSSLAQLSMNDSPLEFTDDEQARLVRIAQNAAKRPILTASSDRPALLLAILDLVTGYAFMHRHDMGDPSVEHAWSTSRVSATLSCLEQFTSPLHVARSIMRRSLAYPLYRSRLLVRKVLAEDVPKIIHAGGRRAVLRAFLELHKSFEASEPHWIWNTLWIEPLVYWITKTGGWTSAKWDKAWLGVFEGWGQMVQGVEQTVAEDWKLDAWEEMAEAIVRGEYDGDEPGESDQASSSSSSSEEDDSSTDDDSSDDDDDANDASAERLELHDAPPASSHSTADVVDKSLLELDHTTSDSDSDDASPVRGSLLSMMQEQQGGVSTPSRPLIQEL